MLFNFIPIHLYHLKEKCLDSGKCEQSCSRYRFILKIKCEVYHYNCASVQLAP